MILVAYGQSMSAILHLNPCYVSKFTYVSRRLLTP